MFAIYSFLIVIYSLIIRGASLFNPKARAFLRGRKNQLSRIRQSIKDWGNAEIIWIHAASYGEYEMAIPIVESLKNQKPDCRWIISFHSPSGYLQHDIDDAVTLKIYLPIDLYHRQERLVNLIQPKAVLFIKYEFWYNLLRVLQKKKIPYYYSSMHLNADSYIFKSYSRHLRKLIKGSRKIFAHNPDSVKIMSSMGFKNAVHFGDSRVDQVLKNKPSGIKIQWTEKNQKTVAFGSLGKEDYPMAAQFVADNQHCNILLAPHDIDHESITSLAKIIGSPVSYYSREGKFPKHTIMIVDTMGDLKYLYAGTDVAYVGGGFAKGPHNVLEPLAFGAAIICGPNIKKFPMAQYLAGTGLLTICTNKKMISRIINGLLNGHSSRRLEVVESFLENNKSKINLILQELNGMNT